MTKKNSPDCTMRLLPVPEVKSALKGTRFESEEDVKEKTACVLKELIEDDFQHDFQQWEIHMSFILVTYSLSI
ncbi:hypothetical protein J6590_066906 [Homalodisca vitripennis]|nr:hypothetical protein J6590_066906 [Homalodisca vitripennis]